jgi:outer membrane protein OmpA-like peptidoglycan-associated protein
MMRRSLLLIVFGLFSALAGAAILSEIFGLPIAVHPAGEGPGAHFLRSLFPVATFALPGALMAIILAEAGRHRSLYYWLGIGALFGAVGFLTLVSGSSSGGSAVRAALPSMRTFAAVMGVGIASAAIYWLSAGSRSGQFAAALSSAKSDVGLDEKGLRKRCRKCTAISLLLGLLPLAMLGWHMIYRQSPMMPAVISAQAEADATRKLTAAGLPGFKLVVEDHVGRVVGTVPDDAARTSSFEKAKNVLEPLVGRPGVVAYLQNDISVFEPGKPVVVVPPADDASKVKAEAAAAKAKSDEDGRDAAEAKRKADEAAVKAKIEEDARLAADAKRKSEEAAAKAKAAEDARLTVEAKQRADDEARLADELAAQKKSEEQAKLAAEDKRKADEAAAKAKAEDDGRLAAEAEAKRAAEAEAKRAAEAEARRVAEAEAAAKKLAEAQEIAAPAVPGPSPVATPSPEAPSTSATCASDFSDLFRSSSVRFGLRSSDIDRASAGYLDRIAELAKRCSAYSVAIGGHADRTGNSGYNTSIAKDRAFAVRDALVERGIATERLSAEGYASERPYDPTNNRAAFQLNRRVDFGASITPPAKVKVKEADANSATVPAQSLLSADQCNAEFSRTFLADTIRFVGSSAIVTDEHARYLDRVADLAKGCPTHSIIINGHTDRRGAATYNQVLSQERANGVRDALVERGVAANRLAATGYAGDRPFDPGNSPEAYALNRRVDFGVAVMGPKN